jgi:hypothetical protein
MYYLKTVNLGYNSTLGFEKEEELQELLRRMDYLKIRGCGDANINRNKMKAI